MTIAYILGTFPSDSEYFIVNEMKELRRNGLNILILALNKGPVSGKGLSGLYNNVIYDKHFLSPVKWFAHLYAFRLNKRRYFHALKEAGSGKGLSFKQCIKVLKRFSTAVYFFYSLRQEPVDQLHAHFLSLPTDIAILISKLANITFSCSAHANDIFTAKKEDLIHKIGKAKFVITCTRFNATYLEKIRKRNEGCIHHIYHGIDFVNWPKRQMRIKDHDKNEIHILTVARLVEKKGIIFLLEAISILIKQGYNIRCSVIGDGPLFENCKNYINDNRLNGIVHLLGALPQDAIWSFYDKADLFILPCINAKDGDKDGLPNVLVEALAVGVPVISTGISAIPELIEHEVTGLLVREKDPFGIADAIVRLRNDAVLYSSIVNTGWKVVDNFNIEYSTAQLIKLFDS